MLVEFSVSNFRSIAEKQSLSLRATRDSAHPGNVIESDVTGRTDMRLLRSALLFGANASGKSNILCALSTLKTLVTERGSSPANAGLDPFPTVKPFLLDPSLKDQPTRFSIVVNLDGTLYEYTIAATSKLVVQERFVRRRPKGPEVTLIDREGANPESWKFHAELGAAARILVDLDPEVQRPLLALATSERFGPLFDLRQWFSRRLWVINMESTPFNLVFQTVQKCKDPKFQDQLGEVLKVADVGIHRVDVQEETHTYFGPSDGADSTHQTLKLEILHTYRVDRTGKEVEMSFFDESNGTQRMIALLGPVIDALKQGATVVFDELECSLHSYLSRELLAAMNDPSLNAKGAQFIIATHDTNLLDRDLVRRDQVWFVKKEGCSGTKIINWYEPGMAKRVRMEAPFAKLYLSGKYDGVPHLGALRESLYDAVWPTGINDESPEDLTIADES